MSLPVLPSNWVETIVKLQCFALGRIMLYRRIAFNRGKRSLFIFSHIQGQRNLYVSKNYRRPNDLSAWFDMATYVANGFNHSTGQRVVYIESLI